MLHFKLELNYLEFLRSAEFYDWGSGAKGMRSMDGGSRGRL